MGDRELIALRSREITKRQLNEIDNIAKKRWKGHFYQRRRA